MSYDHHHPSCQLRGIANPLYCGHYPELDHASCPSSVECAAITLDHLASLCGCVQGRDTGHGLVFSTIHPNTELEAFRVECTGCGWGLTSSNADRVHQGADSHLLSLVQL